MANGKFAGGNGTSNNPFLIEDAADLNAIRYHLTSSFRLISNINLNIAPYNEGLGWNPINEFAGTLDGDGYIISNLYINRPNNDNIGFFGSISERSYIIKNIILDNVYVRGRHNVGVLIGQYYTNVSSNVNSTILNIYISGSLYGYNNVATIIGVHKTYINDKWYKKCYLTITNILLTNKIHGNDIDIFIKENGAKGYYGNSNGSMYYRIFNNILSTNDIQTNTNDINSLQSSELSCSNLYILKNNIPSNCSAPYFTQLSKEQLHTKDYSKFQSLIEAKTTSGYNMFEFNENQEPTYNHERHKYTLIEYDGKYHVYKNNEWIELDIDIENLVPLSNNAIKNIGEIPEKAWNKIKDKNPRIVNIVPQIMNYQSDKQSINITYNEDDTTKLNSSKKIASRVHIDVSDTDILKQIYID